MTYLYIDQANFYKKTAFLPFALTDVFTEDSSANSRSFFHFWQFEQTFILGMKDTRVTDFELGVQSILNNDYLPVIRNSGGLGVIADQGILNISLIFPKNEQTTTDTAYEAMYELTQKAFPELVIDAYEITDSYCPGTFDLSVNGKKIAGIAQRRLKNGVAVMMYLSVNGDQTWRGEIVREFYQTSLKEAFGTDGYPAVDPSCMTTLETVLATSLSVKAVKERFLQALEIQTDAIDPLQWVQENNYTTLLEKKIAGMEQRNLKIKEIHHGDSL